MKVHFAVLLAGLVLFPSLVRAEEQDAAAKKAAEAMKSAELVAGAFRLVEFGRETKSPELLISAAKVLATAPVQQLKVQDAKEEGNFPEDLRKKAEKLVAEALEMAKTQPAEQRTAIESLAKNVTSLLSEKTRGAVGGARGKQVFLNPGQSVQDVFDLRGGSTRFQIVNYPGNTWHYRIQVIGNLTGITYADVSGYNPTANFQHLPVAQVRVIVTCYNPYGSPGGQFTFMTN